ncbi:DNA polymerase III subunit gamma/tau [Pelagibacteraceae bacterium]|jgi:DNA polymerase-3 subunit gamma/tau|nr:DNA polymerase III subunit gamma/tau [Candidatus Pelagibacter bacterium]MDB2344874.1 DNA polymerase III subunit gamma/tau [Candidatus Pelagibacter bacterium]MDC1079402.1 DNA polymerase III subunit gamma/tau [Pelagibacteraceae bacterium]
MINKILALKYRPQEFKDLIGQEIMAQTITNAIKLNKTPNAYLLTGIRGVGKTTTARLIAKALNCQKNDNSNVSCSSEKFCPTCQEIINSNHIDILEMDAASKTGIDDIRELIENSKYSPTSAKFKIFIIDEVHMLSKQAFNGLLKTLEEPPPSLKFILATTEVRKIPVTILSRCQRFDLKRVSVEQLCEHLKKIVDKEKGKISNDAIKLIARTSEGSVRDSISLLDRALISQSIDENKKIEEPDVRQMLGLADKSKIISLFKEVLSGNEKNALQFLHELIDNGLDAKNFLNDILEVLYLFSRRISLGPIEKDISVSEAEVQMVDQYSKNIDMQDISLFWQLTIKTIDDLKIIGNENLMLEMYIMQLTHLKNIDDRKVVLPSDNTSNKILEDNLIGKKNEDKLIENNAPNQIKNQLKSIDQIKTNPIKNLFKESQSTKIEIKSFKDLIDKANKEKEIELKYDLERNVKLVSFNKGNIDISFNEKLNKNFIKNLTEKLVLWTGDRWIISLSKNTDAKSFYEKNLENKTNRIEEFKKSKIAQDVQKAFPDAKLIDLKEEE